MTNSVVRIEGMSHLRSWSCVEFPYSGTQDTNPILWKKTSWPPFLDIGPDFPHRQIKITNSLYLPTGSLKQTSVISHQQ